ncbi:MAG TPA: SIMPL domain-containing protein [Candidatus Saccharimonadales bacterium]|nr:SIMPL domain-containing protein [Candidatus Saccharimonadales bacterium]
MPENSHAPSKTTKLTLSLDFRWVALTLLVVIIAMLAIWRPWSSSDATSRTVEVTGQATITAKPDEFVFMPSYQFKNADKAAALAAITQKSDEVVAKLKALGVAESKIETDSSGYDYPMYYEDDSEAATYTLSLTVTVDNLTLAQKVQDYLLTTSPTGSITPEAQFSDKKRAEVEKQARDKAAKDARSKADQMADNLGFGIGKVKSIDDSAGFDGGIITPMTSRGMTVEDTAATSLKLQPGENDLDYSITVTYFIK